MSDGEFANVNGTISPLHRASVPVNDHGFLYGDSVYETIRTYDRRPFFVPGHLDRLERSARAIRIGLPWTREHIRDEIERTLDAARDAEGDGELAIRLMVTRGSGPLGYDPALCPEPALVILVTRLRPVRAEDLEVGVAAVIASVRRNPIEALDPRIKSSNLLNNILAAHQARDAAAAEAILLNTSGYLAEGTLSNLFLVKAGRLMTPSVECGILSGITRDLLLDLARAHGLPCDQGMYRMEDLLAADEVFLTSTTREVLPVARLDGRPVGGGRRGPVTRRLQDLFKRRVEEMLRAEAGAAGA